MKNERIYQETVKKTEDLNEVIMVIFHDHFRISDPSESLVGLMREHLESKGGCYPWGSDGDYCFTRDRCEAGCTNCPAKMFVPKQIDLPSDLDGKLDALLRMATFRYNVPADEDDVYYLNMDFQREASFYKLQQRVKSH